MDIEAIEAMMKSNTPLLLNNYQQYQKMAQKFFEEFLKYNKEYAGLLDKYGQFDAHAHTPEEQIRYAELIEERQSACIATLVFEAFACEAFMNYLCESIFGSELFQKIENNKLKISYRTSSTIGKLKYFCENNRIGIIVIDTEIEQKVKTLIQTRDDLAHNKLREVRLDMEPNEFLHALWNMGVRGESIYLIVVKSIGICQELINEITRAIQQQQGQSKTHL